MNKAERARIARQNGALSRGPKSPEGRDRARRSALKHGLTATTLTLPHESLEDIQSHADFWLDSYEPETAEETAACSEAALAMLHLERFHKAHNGIIGNQVRYAPTDWDTEQGERLAQAIKLLPKKPEAAVAQLKAFGTGVKWLIKRWELMKEILQTQGCWNNAGLRCQVIHLLGYRAYKLRSAPMEAFAVYLMALYALPEGPPPHVLDHARKELMPPEFLGLHGPDLTLERPDAVAGLLMFLTAQIDELKALSAVFEPLDAQSRAEASVRAMAPQDTAQNKLLLRYLTAASSVLTRTTKQLEATKAARLKAEIAARELEIAAQEAATKAAEVALRNEPSAGAPASYHTFPNKGYARIGGEKYWVDRSEDRWTLTPVEEFPDRVPVMEVPRDDLAPETAA